MITLLTVIIAGILCIVNVIAVITYGCIIFSSMILEVISYILYKKFGFFKFFYHDLLGWHEPDDSPQHHDGCSQHATCKYCGKDIMQDSQGNWF